MKDEAIHGIRFESGSLLPKVVEDYASQQSLLFCDVTGFGALEWAELAGSEDAQIMRFSGPLHLIDLKGRLRTAGDIQICDFVCTLSRHTDNGIQLIGGILKGAEARFLELAVIPLEGPTQEPVISTTAPEAHKRDIPKLVSDSSLPYPAGVGLANKPEAPPAMPSQGDDRWARAIEASNDVMRRAKDGGYEPDAVEIRPNRGDIAIHRQFGRCKVIRVGDDHITLRKPDGRNVQLGLAILKFVKEGTEDNHTIFRVEVRSKR
ncbi:MAG: hypothetical protein QNJ97_00340 [Myxococcota bacterium]|nr:hypothetical protein [Myxococcota bacterium]